MSFKRPKSNQIAFQVMRMLLEAAKDCELMVSGRPVHVKVESRPTEWPSQLPRPDWAAQMPWPAAKQLDCAWEGGQVRLLLEASFWSSNHKQYKGHYGLLLGYYTQMSRQQVVWCSLAKPIDDTPDGQTCTIRANIALAKKKGVKDSYQRSYAVRALVDQDKLKRATPYTVELMVIRVPEGTLQTQPDESFRRLVHLALLKLPYLLQEGTSPGTGVWLFNPQQALTGATPPKDSQEIDSVEEEGVSEEDLPPFLASPVVPQKSGGLDVSMGVPPTNLILYGPPGTGKTFSTVERALTLAGVEVKNRSRKVLQAEFDTLRREGRIELVTFHQSYGYEEFVEGIRPDLDADTPGDVRYRLQEGVLKRLALRAAAAGLHASSQQVTFDSLWMHLVRSVQEEGERLVQGKGGKHYLLRVSGGGSLITTQCDPDGTVTTADTTSHLASMGNARIIWENRHTFGIKPEGYTHNVGKKIFSQALSTSTTQHKGGHHYTTLWIVYNELYELSLQLKPGKTSVVRTPESAQAAIDGIETGKFRFSASTPQFVLIIDEINRGNISKILGELITLLEPDKRLTQDEETRLRLSGSTEHWFALPPNLHIIGTMNTADRSIALMDVALRRRFQFIELMPDPELVEVTLKKLGSSSPHASLVKALLKTLNERIVWLFDRDHQLGHAYFLKATDLFSLRAVFVDRVIPLLQEYFYGAWSRIAAVLGCPLDEKGRPTRKSLKSSGKGYPAPMLEMVSASRAADLGLADELEELRPQWAVSKKFLEAKTEDVLLPYFLGVLSDSEQATFGLSWSQDGASGTSGNGA